MRKWLAALAAAFAALAVSAQEYGVVDISVCNLRATPDFDAEMASQALLGTPVHILQIAEKNSWPEVQTPDTYTGWVHRDAITLLSFEEYHAWNAAPKIVVTALAGTVSEGPSAKAATISDVVAGDRLRDLGRHGRYYRVGFPDGRIGYLHKSLGQPEAKWRASLKQTPEAIIATALTMNGFPYIWAGMSPKGTDCSGFIRTVLFMHDIIIPRDSGPMSRTGERIMGTEDLQPGDPARRPRLLRPQRHRGPEGLARGPLHRRGPIHSLAGARENRQFPPGGSPLRRLQRGALPVRLPRAAFHRQTRRPQYNLD